MSAAVPGSRFAGRRISRSVGLTPVAGRHALRGADAVHVASLLAVGAADTLFAVWDQRRRAGTQSAGVQVAPRR
jgi:hypothetical protein